MTDQLLLSHNELKALVKRCFEGIYGHTQDFDDMACTILWLECHGFNGVETLVKALPNLQNDTMKKPSLTEISNHRFRVDAKGGSLIPLVHHICDLASSLNILHGKAHIEIDNITDAEVILAASSHCNLEKTTVFCQWPNGISYAKKHTLPTTYHNNKLGVSILCGDDIKNPQRNICVKSDTLVLSFEESLNTGLPITKKYYDCLCAVANRVLVKASAASRRGAGE